MDVRRALAEEPHGGLAVGGRGPGHAGRVADGRDGLEHGRFVVHHEDETVARRRRPVRAHSFGLQSPAGGEQEGELGDVSRRAPTHFLVALGERSASAWSHLMV